MNVSSVIVNDVIVHTKYDGTIIYLTIPWGTLGNIGLPIKDDNIHRKVIMTQEEHIDNFNNLFPRYPITTNEEHILATLKGYPIPQPLEHNDNEHKLSLQCQLYYYSKMHNSISNDLKPDKLNIAKKVFLKYIDRIMNELIAPHNP